MFMMRIDLELHIAVWLHLILMVSTDYQCTCNYSKYAVPVYQNTSRTSVLIGILDVNDCKQYLYPVSEKSTAYYAIMFQHQIGFVMDIYITKTNCQGTPPIMDIVTITNSKATTRPLNVTTTITSHTFGQNNTASLTVQTMTTTISPSTEKGSFTLKPKLTGLTSSISTKSPSVNSLVTTATNALASPTKVVLLGHIEMCSSRLQSLAEHSTDFVTQFRQSCYEVVQTGVSWSHAESNCKHNGGHLIHIANQQEQDFIYDVLVKHHSSTVWLGLQDRNQEEKFEWTSGNPVTYTNWKPGRKDYRYHNSEDCVFMTSDKGQWDDIQCGGDNALSELIQGKRHGYICQYATEFPPTMTSSLDGKTHMCPNSLDQQAVRDKGVLGQYDQSCYEIVPNNSVAWQHAEYICRSRGGHLAHIINMKEQAFIQGFLNRYSPNHAVWIGLTDHYSEGRFNWTSGASVQFTNWVPGHLSNFVNSSQEDCVVLIPYKNGQWDDIPCGHTQHALSGGLSSSGEVHPLLCQYRISAGPSLIG